VTLFSLLTDLESTADNEIVIHVDTGEWGALEAKQKIEYRTFELFEEASHDMAHCLQRHSAAFSLFRAVSHDIHHHADQYQE
jgi:hypothetical protein